ncbi:MAG: protein kinase [Chloroflexi bacterium]|uniref:non-specific serine/threonine protein kinase n=1 Tax=Candidatus Chlorohelix allophototropha TaxID=3003348 RepID=A0A8T7M5F2_9CHLR|nr:protein kinase [Chloroflexota bacterium]WJW69197.1 protein kinase [Chloroflexota bacterium L227-S17]
MAERKPGDIILGKYEIKQRLGKGGGGVVYLAYEASLRRNVAIKELINSSDLRQSGQFEELNNRFEREAILNAQFTSYPVITIYGKEIDKDGNIFLVMELAPRGSLYDLLQNRQGKPMSLDEFYPLAYDILKAVKAIHAHPSGIVHRDVKPSNILLTDNGAKLADFGVAQLAEESSRSRILSKSHPGTPLYMSPEQEKDTGYLDNRSDLYSIGLVFYEMLTGERYKMKRVMPPSKLNSAVTPMLDYIIQHMIEQDRDKRYNTADDILADMEKAKRGAMPPEMTVPNPAPPTVVIPPVPSTSPKPTKKKGAPVVAILVGLVILIVAGVGAFFALSSNSGTSQAAVAATATSVPTTTIAEPTATVTPVPTATPQPTATVTPVPTATPQPTATPTVAPTVTPLPTATVAATTATTAAGTPTNPVSLPFEDNFKGGAKADWRPVNEQGNSKWAVDNGGYTLLSGGKGAVFIGDTSWENYSLKIKIWELPGELAQVSILVRYQDESNYLYLNLSGNSAQWISIKNGRPTLLNRDAKCYAFNAFGNCGYLSPLELNIVVQDTNIYAYSGTTEIAKFEATTDTKDLIPLKGYAGIRIDMKNNNKPPRIESVKISKV